MLKLVQDSQRYKKNSCSATLASLTMTFFKMQPVLQTPYIFVLQNTYKLRHYSKHMNLSQYGKSCTSAAYDLTFVCSTIKQASNQLCTSMSTHMIQHSPIMQSTTRSSATPYKHHHHRHVSSSNFSIFTASKFSAGLIMAWVLLNNCNYLADTVMLHHQRSMYPLQASG